MKTQKGNRRKGSVAGARLAYDALPKPKHATLHKKGTSWTDAVKKAPSDVEQSFDLTVSTSF